MCTNIASAKAATDARSVKTRVINFPDQGLGQYFFASQPDGHFMVIWPEQQKTQTAKGRVLVPEDKEVTLATGWGDGAKLSLLLRLQPNDIQNLDLVGSTITAESLKCICALKQLKGINLAGTYVNDKDISLIASDLPLLQELDISSTPNLSNRCLDNLPEMRHLSTLSLAGNKQLKDVGFLKLAEIKSLRSLNLTDTSLTDACLPAICKMHSISTLNLSQTKITDRGLSCLANMPSLKKLDVSGTAVTDEGVKEVIGKLPMIEELNLSKTQITDEGVKHLAKLVNLRKLWLRDLPKVTDVSIPALSAHSSLQDLEIQKTLITTPGVSQLGKQLPGSEVHSKSPCKCRKHTRVN